MKNKLSKYLGVLIIGLVVQSVLFVRSTEAAPENVLHNSQFGEAENNLPTGWTAFEGGFTFSPKAGREGHTAVSMIRAETDKARGLSQNIVLNQKESTPIVLSGWSKALNVSGVADNDYAVFADLTYADGTNGWGFNAPFKVGTTDWNEARTEIKPEKAVKSLTFYALFRNHTGQVWFSDLKVETQVAAVPPQDLVKVDAQKNFESKPFQEKIDPKGAVMRVVPTQIENRLVNPSWQNVQNGVPQGWQKWNDGFQFQATGGRENHPGVFIESVEGAPERGIWQEVILNQTEPQPLLLSGWSKAENVSGTPDANYSLYADLTLKDGTQMWGESAPFLTATHDWQYVTHVITPSKPVKSIKVYALFRGHSGKAWFSDLSLGHVKAPEGATMFDALAVQKPGAATPVAQGFELAKPTKYATKDGLALSLYPDGGIQSLQIDGRELKSASPGGFLARDVANRSDFFPFKNGVSDPLQLKIDSKVTAFDDHLVVEGNVSDLTGQDRAISLFFSLPVDTANGWNWSQTMRQEKPIGAEELSNTVAFFAGSNGQHSLYPFANIHDEKSGLAIALDPEYAAQNRLAVNGATKQFYLAYDFGLTPEKSSADFKFVIYRTDPQWGFRDALGKMEQIYPASFEVRDENKKQGLWMPFTAISEVQGWQDFGFRFREATENIGKDPSLKWDDENGILTFRYFEPMTWWMPMPDSMTRDYDTAVKELQRVASDPKANGHKFAQAVVSSGFRDTSGRYVLSFRDMPWAKGAVWSINPDPKIKGEMTGATVGWNPTDRDALYKNNPSGKLDGEYLDSLEGYVTANLNFDRDQFKVARAPLTFETSTFTPAQHKALLVYDYLRDQSKDVHSMGKLMFANSVPYRFTFLTSYLDVMGTETNWLTDGNWTPDSDDLMSLRRAMSGAKPYLLLQNTDYDKFTPAYVEKYMQRTLFYGMFPGFFSADAATKPYWLNPTWYNRDRPLFKKYIPIIKRVAEAGWQPLTLAKSDNKSVWVECFGNGTASTYLTIRNETTAIQKANVTVQAPLAANGELRDLVSGQIISANNGILALQLQPEQTVALQLR